MVELHLKMPNIITRFRRPDASPNPVLTPGKEGPQTEDITISKTTPDQESRIASISNPGLQLFLDTSNKGTFSTEGNIKTALGGPLLNQAAAEEENQLCAVYQQALDIMQKPEQSDADSEYATKTLVYFLEDAAQKGSEATANGEPSQKTGAQKAIDTIKDYVIVLIEEQNPDGSKGLTKYTLDEWQEKLKQDVPNPDNLPDSDPRRIKALYDKDNGHYYFTLPEDGTSSQAGIEKPGETPLASPETLLQARNLCGEALRFMKDKGINASTITLTTLMTARMIDVNQPFSQKIIADALTQAGRILSGRNDLGELPIGEIRAQAVQLQGNHTAESALVEQIGAWLPGLDEKYMSELNTRLQNGASFQTILSDLQSKYKSFMPGFLESMIDPALKDTLRDPKKLGKYLDMDKKGVESMLGLLLQEPGDWKGKAFGIGYLLLMLSQLMQSASGEGLEPDRQQQQ